MPLTCLAHWHVHTSKWKEWEIDKHRILNVAVLAVIGRAIDFHHILSHPSKNRSSLIEACQSSYML